MKRISKTLFAAICLAAIACSPKKSEPIDSVKLLINNEDQLTQVIIYDVFTPPVASRIYVYSSIAAYEALRFSKANTTSIAEKLNGFGKMPQPDSTKKYDFNLAASEAFFKVTRYVKVFSVDSLTAYENNIKLPLHLGIQLLLLF